MTSKAHSSLTSLSTTAAVVTDETIHKSPLSSVSYTEPAQSSVESHLKTVIELVQRTRVMSRLEVESESRGRG